MDYAITIKKTLVVLATTGSFTVFCAKAFQTLKAKSRYRKIGFLLSAATTFLAIGFLPLFYDDDLFGELMVFHLYGLSISVLEGSLDPSAIFLIALLLASPIHFSLTFWLGKLLLAKVANKVLRATSASARRLS